VFERWIS
jgi:hypothetical protein